MKSYIIKGTFYHLAGDVEDTTKAEQDLEIALEEGTVRAESLTIAETKEDPDKIISLKEAFDRANRPN